MTLPGVPMVFAGDELGLEGQWGEDARRTMPWGQPRRRRRSSTRSARSLRLRARSAALARGGIRWVHVDADTIAFLRETRDERLLCVALGRARADRRRVSAGSNLSRGELERVLPCDAPQFQIWRLE